MTAEALRQACFIFKKIKFLGPHTVVLMYLAIYYYCTTDIDEAKVISELQHKSKFNFVLFWK